MDIANHVINVNNRGIMEDKIFCKKECANMRYNVLAGNEAGLMCGVKIHDIYVSKKLDVFKCLTLDNNKAEKHFDLPKIHDLCQFKDEAISILDI